MHQPQGCSRVFQTFLRPFERSELMNQTQHEEFLNIWRWWNTIQRIFRCLSLRCLKTPPPAVLNRHFKSKSFYFLFFNVFNVFPKVASGLRHLRTSTRLRWRFWIDWILFILFTSHLRWSPRPLLHSWQPMRPATVSDRDVEISRARLSEVKSGVEGKIYMVKSGWGFLLYTSFTFPGLAFYSS